MKITPTIRAELEHFLQQENLTLSQFGQITGMNRGIISSIVTGNKSMSINQLDRITEAMGLPEGHFYDLFIENYIIDTPPNMRRIEPFLFRCAELDKLDAIRRVVGAIMDNLLYSPKLFEIAEELLSQGRHEAALILYEGVAEAERYQHSERLAVCQYRIFTIQIGDDQSRNIRAAAVFEAFVERLDEIDQLDALKDLANVYRSLRKWDKVDEIARKMKQKAKTQYLLKHQHKNRECDEYKKLSRPLFVYISYADLLCAGVYEAQGDYNQALQYTYAYADLDWVKETDEDTKHWISLFQHWAQANVIVNKLLSGDMKVLNDYVEYIAASSDTTDQDRVTQLLNIMMTANRYQIDVNDILQRFETDVNSLLQLPQFNDVYTQHVIPEQFARLGYELAYYYLHQGTYDDGFKYLMYSLVSYHRLNNETYFIKCLVLFERYRVYAVSETKAAYLEFIERVWIADVKKNGAIDRRN
ncbi:helix-turn-helix transcriptional regulator [Paenibacillus polymyxa]|uniref:Helix-turn-helix domain-containing protein n=1 Tax=Paenibacillus polymyxa TaxID=1406 RepID=A0A378Y1Z5_PAEPO|nr:helix-turn-helix transcriptional regulator [Paenibacillus polymyxa]MBE7896295.1 helix-turn-helix transcriptional regulator [Paenibacillus polymyxa]MBG9765789.1 DNA-binding protein [Paenibacillus polymyxa]MCC3256824.1 helix-turn-helix transcriptional regulator [Paenibacillus polymyxa]QPK54694.1 helix-turn-helix transcriptional regulator [Paenibacillus polymyxa]QPK59783.1 helix-turn-helix transcriptional regulator [Paenibacillus polymyxa]